MARLTNVAAPDREAAAACGVARCVVYALAVMLCLSPWGSPGVALALGIAVAVAFDAPLPRAGRRISKRLLQASVALLGFTMDLQVVLRAGADGLLFAAGTIFGTLALGWVLGRWLRVPRTVSTLVAVGTAICGGSAIAAVGSVVGAAEAEMSVAIGTVFLLNAAALYLFPVAGHLLGLSDGQFGTWAGVAIHDISSVVGAAAHYSLAALQTATAVKLSRALWIVPVSLAFARLKARRGEQAGASRAEAPWFIGLFVLASVVRTLLPGAAHLAPVAGHVAAAGMTVTLFLIGAGLSRGTLRSVGWRPLVQGVALWGFISAVALGVVRVAVR